MLINSNNVFFLVPQLKLISLQIIIIHIWFQSSDKLAWELKFQVNLKPDNNIVMKFYCLILLNFQSWDSYFRNNAYRPPPSLAPAQPGHVPISQFGHLFAGAGGGLGRAEPDEKTIDDHLAVQAIIRSYQVKNSQFFDRLIIIIINISQTFSYYWKSARVIFFNPNMYIFIYRFRGPKLLQMTQFSTKMIFTLHIKTAAPLHEVHFECHILVNFI